MSSIKRNYLYNLLYQIYALLTPFITAPYISRILGSVGVGQYALTYTIASYFVLLGSLGFAYYAQREIASYQKDKHKQSILFWEILIARGISLCVVVCIYIGILLLGIFSDYTELMSIWLIFIISTIFDISFYFQGNDDFGSLALRNIIIRTIGIFLIIIFVKEKADVYIYAFCQSIISVVANFSLWPRLKGCLVSVKIIDINLKKHFRPTLLLFIPTLAVSVYTMLDRLLIGLLLPGYCEIRFNDGSTSLEKVSDVENGFYEQSEKIVKLAMTFFTSLSTVMISRNSKELSDGNYEGFKENVIKTIKFLQFIGCPIMFGLAAVAYNFCPWFFGIGFDKVPSLIIMFSPIVLIIGLSNILGRQYLIPLKKDNFFSITICIGAISNLILNINLIPIYYSYGAAISSVIAELFVTSVMLYFARKDININHLLSQGWKYWLSSLLMFLIVFPISKSISSSIYNTIILTLAGGLIYFLLLIVLKDKFLISRIGHISLR